MKKLLDYFTLFEKLLWLFSATAIVVSFLLFDERAPLNLIASLVGVTFLIFNAKGNPIGQFLTIVFSVMYGIISYSCAYYGEMLTYVCMSGPMALFALISWLRHPYEGRHSEVKVNSISRSEVWLIIPLSAAVTVLFYFILKHLGTASLIPSTFSVTTSFIAVYLTFRRSPGFALAYASNDIVLMVLWAIAARQDRSYISVFVCFFVFLINDLYGFSCWMRMKKRQSKT